MPHSAAGPTSMTLSLVYPIEYDGKTITEVHLRRPRVGDMMAAQGRGPTNAADLELAMVAQISGVPVEALMQLDMQDYHAIQAALRGFNAGN